jgi:hypothetical protein
MATAGQVLTSLMLGGLLGIVGQAARAIVGLKRPIAESESDFREFDAARLFIGFILGFVAGIVGVLLLGLDSFSTVDTKSILALAAFGYIGTDIIEGLLGFSPRRKSSSKPKSPPQIIGAASAGSKSSDVSNLNADAKLAFDLKDPSIFAGSPGRSIPQKSEDVQICASQWLQHNKNVSSADSRNLNRNISDFHISTNNEMEQFIWGVAQCLSGRNYTYVPDPAKDSPEWNSHVSKLLNGTLSTLVKDFISNIS